jgi:3-oxoacyl-[acyl-carrier protein] reductase
MKKALVIGSSKGIGKAISNKLKDLNFQLITPSRKELDTSNIISVKKFIKIRIKYDIVILNTGGPPAMNFFDIKENDWIKYFNQLFLSFVLILQNIKINKNGYIFLISSHTIKNPEEKLVLSNSYRVALSSILKTVSKILSKDKISCINIAPGPIKTKRLKNLVYNVKKFEKTLPLGYAAHPNEIALFIKAIIENKIKYLNGVTINFDGGISPSLF